MIVGVCQPCSRKKCLEGDAQHCKLKLTSDFTQNTQWGHDHAAGVSFSLAELKKLFTLTRRKDRVMELAILEGNQ